MKKQLVLMVILVMTLNITACGGVDKQKTVDTFNKVSGQLDEVTVEVNKNLELVDSDTLDDLNAIAEKLIDFKGELGSDDITQERADEILAELKKYPDEIAELKTKTEEMIANPEADSTDAGDWNYKDVTPEQIQAISDVLDELIPLYEEAAAAVKENGWEADETVVEEMNSVYAVIEAAQYGVADPSGYEGTEDMNAVVEQYQMILGAMPDLIAKVSQPYSN